MTTENFNTSQPVEFTGEELCLLLSCLSSYLDYLRAHKFHSTHERAFRLFEKVGQYIDVL